jgi:tRNA pseudouridine38-40 synthase
MPRYKLTIEYNGAGYAGWQKQPDRLSIQEAIEAALQKFCGEAVEVCGAGRTDAGVHATAQVAHIDLGKQYEPYNVMQGINFYLFGGREEATTSTNRIAITHAEQVADDFHARFSATRRSYLYRIVNRRTRLGLDAGRAWQVGEVLEEQAMQQAAGLLLGHHDFTSFRDSACQAKSPLRTLEGLDVRRVGEDILIRTHARSFLHHQVRIMVGTLVQVGKGRWQPVDVQRALEAKKRSASGPTAPPEGLYLVGVGY